MTPLDIITLALRRSRVLGVGQTVSDDDADVALRELNLMLSQWARQRYMVYRTVDLAKIATGAQTYTVGPGGDFDIEIRPDILESAFLRQFPAAPIVVSGPAVPVVPTSSPFFWQASEAGTLTVTGGSGVSLQFSDASEDPTYVAATSPVTVDTDDGVLVTYVDAPTITFTPAATTTVPAPVPSNAVDYHLEILHSREDYNRIVLKGLQTFTYLVFYDPSWPMGTLYPYPFPPAGGSYELHITAKMPLVSFTSLAQDVNLPGEYEAAMVSNLAVILRNTIAGLAPDPALSAMAKDAKEIIRGTAAAIPRLVLPGGIRRRVGAYNVYSDQGR